MIPKAIVRLTAFSPGLFLFVPVNSAYAEATTSISMWQEMSFEGDVGSTSTYSNNTFNAVVGTCAEVKDDMCISKVEIKTEKSNQWKEMISNRLNFNELFCRGCSGYTQTTWKRDSRGLPSGELPSRWTQDENSILVQAGIAGSFSEGSELNRPNWKSANTKFFIHGMSIKINSGQLSEHNGTSFRLTFNIRDRSEAINGFFDGRLSESHLEITPQNEFIVEGKPVVVSSARAQWINSQIPNEVIDFFMQNYYKPGSWVGVPPPTSWKTNDSNVPFGYSFGNSMNLDFPAFDFFEKYFDQKLTKDSSVWSVSNFGASWNATPNKCFSIDQTVGMATTNANIYTRGIPEWDPTAQTLNFRIASPHKKSSGEETRGSYDLTLSESTAKCFWNLISLPDSAELRITYPDGAAEVATVTLTVKNGFIYFHAKGFHFSSPNVKVKLIKPTPTPTATPNVTPTPSTIPTPNARPVNTKTIYCKRKSNSIKVVGKKPNCPKGYSLIKAKN